MVAGVVLWAGCGGDDDDTPTGTITMTVTPMSIDDLGGTAMVAVDVKDADGAVATGAVSLGASAGGFEGGSGSGVIKTLVDGKATAIFSCRKALDASCASMVTITAAWNAARASSTLMITTQPVDAAVPDAAIPDAAPADANLNDSGTPQISWVSTRCAGNNCTIMGIRNSGFNEIAQVTFRLADSLGMPIEGATVRFSINLPPSGTVVTASGVTDAGGNAIATVNSGLLIGVFAVTATYMPGVETNSPSIGIRGAKAANEGFQIECDRINIGAYVSPTPPRIDTANCRVILVDRYNNPVGTGTSVNFKTEAGTVPNSVATKPYDTMGMNNDEGRGNFVFSTAGTYPPVDVAPLPALPTQYPIGRDAEPSQPVGALTLNPRDSLVTVIAYLRGEEKFFDNNSNGTRDPGERFIDQGEAFVDADDNGVWDPGETYIDDAPANNVWDGPNGVWDSDTTISTEIRIMYSDRPVPQTPMSEVIPPVFSNPCPNGLPKASGVDLTVIWGDQYFNPPQMAGTSFAASNLGVRGSVQNLTPGYLDGYGNGLTRILVDASSGLGCLTTTPICRWRVQYSGWRYPIQSFRVIGATDTMSCAPTGVQAQITVLSQIIALNVSGAMN
ncbi:MAG: Ig-like domain-containing protein [Deltaproteobacteria bacterium]|nr:Ig-like domain-containing protein [Deltaproteobacteria bacterium]